MYEFAEKLACIVTLININWLKSSCLSQRHIIVTTKRVHPESTQFLADNSWGYLDTEARMLQSLISWYSDSIVSLDFQRRNFLVGHITSECTEYNTALFYRLACLIGGQLEQLYSIIVYVCHCNVFSIQAKIGHLQTINHSHRIKESSLVLSNMRF